MTTVEFLSNVTLKPLFIILATDNKFVRKSGTCKVSCIFTRRSFSRTRVLIITIPLALISVVTLLARFNFPMFLSAISTNFDAFLHKYAVHPLSMHHLSRSFALRDSKFALVRLRTVVAHKLNSSALLALSLALVFSLQSAAL